ncbi:MULTISPECIES: GNAT family N-acetyltransferase [unclassified Janibacter]|uniref:GNAT family N-acetyltransferase n=1 Tax=unclassified Janibacter TaxID=2649294 RepID=UPI003D02CDDE
MSDESTTAQSADGVTAVDRVAVVNAAGEHRFEITVDDTLAGFASYLDVENQRIFFHTVVFDAFGGQGLAGRLVDVAVAETSDAGLRIVPVCPYVATWLTRHEEYAGIVDPVSRESLLAVQAQEEAQQ